MATQLAKNSVEARLERTHYQMMKHPVFCAYSGLIFMGNSTVTDSGTTPDGSGRPMTACIDRAGNRTYGRSFMDALNEKEFNFLVLHEITHFALLHVFDHNNLCQIHAQAYALAIDHVVNNMIVDSDPNGEFAVMPTNPDGSLKGALDRKYKGWSVPMVFKDLLKNAEKGGGKGKGKGQGGGNELGEGGPDADGSSSAGMDVHQHGKGNEGENGTPEEQKAMEEKLRGAIEEALRQGAYLAGKLGGNVHRGLGEVLEPKVDWKQQLADFIQETCQGNDEATWRRPNRRFLHEDTYLPSTHSEAIGKLVFGIDTSGSIGGKELTAAVGEFVSLCKMMNPTEVHLMYWDTRVAGHEIYKQGDFDQILTSTKPAGGGGTCVLDMARKVHEMTDVVAVVNVTDGYVGNDFGQWNVPTLWCITTDIVSSVGKTIKLEV